MEKASRIMDEKAMQRALARIAHEIIEKNKGTEDVCLIGIRRRGVPIAKQLHSYIKEFEGVDLDFGEIDITWYRDDLTKGNIDPMLNSYAIDFDIKDKIVIIVDDVIYTGRTARAALDLIMDIARPKRIQLAVLIDRGHRELPIRADYVGKNLPTSRHEIVKVMCPEFDGESKVMLYNKD